MTVDEKKNVHCLSRPVRESPEFASVEYYRRSAARMVLYVFLAVCSALALLVASSWWIQCFTRVARKTVADPESADYALVKGEDGKFGECKIHVVKPAHGKGVLKYFEYKKNRYVFSPVTGMYERELWRLREPLANIYAAAVTGGLPLPYAQALLRAHGPNAVDIPNANVLVMLLHKVAHPFYLFQVFSCFLWFFVDYELYAGMILVMSALSIAWELYSAKHSERKLRGLMKCEASVKVFRGKGNLVSIPACELVLGDLVVVESTKPVVADMAIVSGEAVVNESSLTGESHPVPKYRIPYLETPGDAYTPEKYKNNTLFAGSTVVHAKADNDSYFCHGGESNVLAVVVATGFSTSKGEMFRSILFPSKVEVKIYRDSYYFLASLAVVAVSAFIIRLTDGLAFGQVGAVLGIQSLNLVTIAVPPALPLILTVGIGFALRRLNKHHIFSIDPERINFVGRVNIFCFDKTGTLTTENLQYHSVVSINPTSGEFAENSLGDLPDCHPIETVLATCHGLSKIGDGSLVGPAVDQEMFRATKWSLENPDAVFGAVAVVVPPKDSGTARSSLAILKRFEFDPHLARASVLFYEMDGISGCQENRKPRKMFAACKGSAESIVRLCRPSSIPPTFDQMLREYSNMGLYVLACALKKIDASAMEDENRPSAGVTGYSTVKRSTIERDLDFVGFLVLANPLKPESHDVVDLLRASAVRSVIITGDSTLTAVAVARELAIVDKALLIDAARSDDSEKATMTCHIFGEQRTQPESFTIPKLEHALCSGMDLAMTGAAIDHMTCSGEFDDQFIRFLVRKTKVFGRARPNQKSWIVGQLMAMGNFVGMCGDGMNDCGALKTAHAGIALSNTDASIVAPFTSRRKRILDVVTLLKEGRCAMETSLTAFKYMMLYPIIQTMMEATLNHEKAAMSATQFIFDDLFIVLGLSLLMLYTGPPQRLRSGRPPGTLFHPLIISSVAGQVLICGIFFTIAHAYLYKQPWLCTVEESVGFFSNPAGYAPPADRRDQVCLETDSHDDEGEFSRVNYQTTQVWLYGHFQYVITAVAFNLFTHFRSPMWTNWLFTLFAAVTFGCCTYLLLAPKTQWLTKVLSLVVDNVPLEFKLVVLAVAVANFAAAVLWEYAVVERLVSAMVAHASRRKVDRQRMEERELLRETAPVHARKSWLAIQMGPGVS